MGDAGTSASGGVISSEQTMQTTTTSAAPLCGRKLSYPAAIDAQLVQYVMQEQKGGVILSPDMLRREALQLIQPYCHEFKASTGWLDKFLARHKLSLHPSKNLHLQGAREPTKRIESDKVYSDNQDSSGEFTSEFMPSRGTDKPPSDGKSDSQLDDDLMDDDDDDDEIDDKKDAVGIPEKPVNTERLKAFNMFVRLFIDENLDRLVPISKQPKEKINAIIMSCQRQFPEFSDRARKRIRTYLKSCRRSTRLREPSSKPSMTHIPASQLTEVNNILAQACQNETNEAAKRQRIDSTSGSNPSELVAYAAKINQHNAPVNASGSSTSIHNHYQKTYRVHHTTPHATNQTTSNRIHPQHKAIDEHVNRRGPYNKTNTQKGVPHLPSYLPSSLKAPLMKLSSTEVASIRALIEGYRQSAAFLTRSAEELDNLLKHSEAYPDETVTSEVQSELSKKENVPLKRKLDEQDAPNESNSKPSTDEKVDDDDDDDDDDESTPEMLRPRMENSTSKSIRAEGSSNNSSRNEPVSDALIQKDASKNLTDSHNGEKNDSNEAGNARDQNTKTEKNPNEVLQPVPELLHLPNTDTTTNSSSEQHNVKSPISRMSVTSEPVIERQQVKTTPVRISIAQPVNMVENITKSPITIHSQGARSQQQHHTPIITQALSIVGQQYQMRSPVAHQLRQLQPILPRTQSPTVLYAHQPLHQVSSNQQQQQQQQQSDEQQHKHQPQQQQQHLQHKQPQQQQQQGRSTNQATVQNLSTRPHNEHTALIPGQMYLIHGGSGSQQVNRHISEQSSRMQSSGHHSGGHQHQQLQVGSAAGHQQTIFNFESPPQQLLEVRPGPQYSHQRVSPHSNSMGYHSPPSNSPMLQGINRQSHDLGRQTHVSGTEMARQVHPDYPHGGLMVYDNHQSH